MGGKGALPWLNELPTFFHWILSQEGDATIESPPALQEAFRTMAKQVADLYREDADA